MSRARRLGLGAAVAAAALGAVPLAVLATSLPQRTFPVSTSAGPSGPDATVSMDGGSVVYDAGGNVYLAGVLTGSSRLVSVGQGGAPANGVSSTPVVSADGNVVAFASAATNLTGGGRAGPDDIYVRSGAGQITDVSVAVDGGPANGPSLQPAISADGRYVAFASAASNLVSGDTNGVSDVFVRDLATDTTTRVSVGRGGAEANGASAMPAISATGAAISFDSAATNLVADDHNAINDVFVRIPATDTTERVSVSSSGVAQNASVAAPFVQISSISGDGRLVTFDSNATNLVSGEDRAGAEQRLPARPAPAHDDPDQPEQRRLRGQQRQLRAVHHAERPLRRLPVVRRQPRRRRWPAGERVRPRPQPEDDLGRQRHRVGPCARTGDRHSHARAADARR